MQRSPTTSMRAMPARPARTSGTSPVRLMQGTRGMSKGCLGGCPVPSPAEPCPAQDPLPCRATKTFAMNANGWARKAESPTALTPLLPGTCIAWLGASAGGSSRALSQQVPQEPWRSARGPDILLRHTPRIPACEPQAQPAPSSPSTARPPRAQPRPIPSVGTKRDVGTTKG